MWRGFCFDILDALKEVVGFSYIVTTNDHTGALNESSGLWTGLIGDVAYNRADMAIGALTVNNQRLEVR